MSLFRPFQNDVSHINVIWIKRPARSRNPVPSFSVQISSALIVNFTMVCIWMQFWTNTCEGLSHYKAQHSLQSRCAFHSVEKCPSCCPWMCYCPLGWKCSCCLIYWDLVGQNQCSRGRWVPGIYCLCWAGTLLGRSERADLCSQGSHLRTCGLASCWKPEGM